MIKASSDKLLTISMIRGVGLLFGCIAVFYAPVPDKNAFFLIAVSTLFHYLYYYCFTNAYKSGDYSLVYPISRGIAPVVVLLLSVACLSSELNLTQISATLLIVFSIFLMAHSKARPQLQPIIFALLTGICISGYTIVGAISFEAGLSFLSYFAWLEIFTGLGVVATALILRQSKCIDYMKENYRAGTTAGVLSVFSYGVALWAITLLPVAPVAAIRETSIVFAALIGSFRLKESIPPRNYIAVTAIFCGVLALALYG